MSTISERFEVDCTEPGHECINDEDTLLIPEKCISHTAALECTESLPDYLEQDNMLLSDK
jgi:hypothetical protein